jgi:hypothetical protein
VNGVAPVRLLGDETIIVSTGASPVGVSFQESGCTGFLAQAQQFYPPLANACARASDLIPDTQENESRLGSECFNYMSTLPQCTFPTGMPATLSQSCKSAISNALSYNGCVRAYGSDARFGSNTWRLYLSSGVELWRNSHDVVRLLDAQGLTVDTLSY